MPPTNCRCSNHRRCSCDSHCAVHCLLRYGPNDGWMDNLNSTLMMRPPFGMVQRCPDFDGPAMWPMVGNMFHARYSPDPKCHDCYTLRTCLCRPQLLSTTTTMPTVWTLMLRSVFHYCCSVLSYHPFPNYHRFCVRCANKE